MYRFLASCLLLLFVLATAPACSTASSSHGEELDEVERTPAGPAEAFADAVVAMVAPEDITFRYLCQCSPSDMGYATTEECLDDSLGDAHLSILRSCVVASLRSTEDKAPSSVMADVSCFMTVLDNADACVADVLTEHGDHCSDEAGKDVYECLQAFDEASSRAESACFSQTTYLWLDQSEQATELNSCFAIVEQMPDHREVSQRLHERFATPSEKAEEARRIVSEMADGAHQYYAGDQVYARSEPSPWEELWHQEDRENGQFAGTPVPFDEKVFPGGPNIRLLSSPDIPEEGAKIPFAPIFDGDVDFDVEPVLRALNLHLSEDTYFRYTFETGPGTGFDATARIIAEANFDTSTDDIHTVTVELEATSEGVVVHPASWENEFQ